MNLHILKRSVLHVLYRMTCDTILCTIFSQYEKAPCEQGAFLIASINYTSLMIAISAASPRRGPILTMLV